MNKAKMRDALFGYTEKHHILPRCLGGEESVDNIAVLTAREHYIAHLLLTKMTDGDSQRKMAYAVICFNRQNRNHVGRARAKSRQYEKVKALLSQIPVSKETSEKIRNALRGKSRPQSVRDAISRAHRGKKVSDEARAKMRNAKLGRVLPHETREKMSLAKRGIALTEEHRKNISKAYVKSDVRSKAIAVANTAKRKPCTVDGIRIYESKRALEQDLGRGRQGSRSPTFRYLEH
jgi:predicted transcriptional regulator